MKGNGRSRTMDEPRAMRGRVYGITVGGKAMWTYFIRIGEGRPDEKTIHADGAWATEEEARIALNDHAGKIGKPMGKPPQAAKNAIEGCRFEMLEGRCQKTQVEGFEFCEHHQRFKCRCGAQAVRECGHEYRCTELLCAKDQCQIVGH